MPLRTALLSAAGCLALSGCGSPTETPAVAAAPTLPDAPKDGPANAQEPTPLPTPQPGAQPNPAPKQVDPPVVPTDLAGKAVTKALMPSVPGSPEPPTVKGPRPRTTDLDRGELPLPKVPGVQRPSPLPKAKPALPSPPVERSPLALGDAAAVGPDVFPMADRPLLKAPSPVNPGATDIPAMARQLPDRAPVDDPTVELSAKGVVVTPFPLPNTTLPYLKATIPDPFEFAEHLKGKLGKDTEFGTAPAVVNPEKK